MSDPTRPTVEKSELIDAFRNPPTPGTKLYALNHGGVLVPVVWASNSINDFDAYMLYPKVLASVKERQLSRLWKKKESDNG